VPNQPIFDTKTPQNGFVFSYETQLVFCLTTSCLMGCPFFTWLRLVKTHIVRKNPANRHLDSSAHRPLTPFSHTPRSYLHASKPQSVLWEPSRWERRSRVGRDAVAANAVPRSGKPKAEPSGRERVQPVHYSYNPFMFESYQIAEEPVIVLWKVWKVWKLFFRVPNPFSLRTLGVYSDEMRRMFAVAATFGTRKRH
jgi:hypothetical protein